MKGEYSRYLGNVETQHEFHTDFGKIRNIEELHRSLLKKGIHFFDRHVNSNKNDFANWVNFCIGDFELGEMLSDSESYNETVKTLKGRIDFLKFMQGYGAVINEEPPYDIKTLEMLDISDFPSYSYKPTMEYSWFINADEIELCLAIAPPDNRRNEEILDIPPEIPHDSMKADLIKKEQEILSKEKEIDKTHQKVREFHSELMRKTDEIRSKKDTLDNLSRELSDLQTALKIKQEELLVKEQSLNRKASIINRRHEDLLASSKIIDNLKTNMKGRSESLTERENKLTFKEKLLKLREYNINAREKIYTNMIPEIDNQIENYQRDESLAIDRDNRLHSAALLETQRISNMSEERGSGDNPFFKMIFDESIQKCREILESGSITKAKIYYNSIRENYSKLTDSEQRTLIRDKMVELYDDIQSYVNKEDKIEKKRFLGIF